MSTKNANDQVNTTIAKSEGRGIEGYCVRNLLKRFWLKTLNKTRETRSQHVLSRLNHPAFTREDFIFNSPRNRLPSIGGNLIGIKKPSQYFINRAVKNRILPGETSVN